MQRINTDRRREKAERLSLGIKRGRHTENGRNNKDA